MTTLLQRFVNARVSIQLIDKYIKDGCFTAEVSNVEKMPPFPSLTANKQTFTSCTAGSMEYRDRAAILKEFEAAADCLNVERTDPIRQTRPGFWSHASEMYSMRTIIAHGYGVSVKVDYKLVWDTITGPLQADVAPVIEELIEEQRNREGEDKALTDKHVELSDLAPY
jgi:hypothetical protein